MKNFFKKIDYKRLFISRLPLILIFIMIIMFFYEIFHNYKGIIFSLGWTSLWIFLVLLIWRFIGSGIVNSECPDCGAYCSYVKISDEKVGKHYDSKKRIDYYGHEEKIRYTITEHEGIFKCRKCGREETRKWETSRRKVL